jgi:hypothetical protein
MGDNNKVTKIEISPITVPEEVITDLVAPTSKIIGQVLGAALNKLFLKARKSYLIDEHEIHELTTSLKNKSNSIPEMNRTIDNLAITHKIIDDAEYKLKKQELRELFENLVTTSLDNRYTNLIHPKFSSVLKELDSDEALLLKYLHQHNSITLVRPFYVEEDPIIEGSIAYFNQNNGYDFMIEYPEVDFDSFNPYRDIYNLKLKSTGVAFSMSVLEGEALIYEKNTSSSVYIRENPFEPTLQKDELLDEKIRYYLSEDKKLQYFLTSDHFDRATKKLEYHLIRYELTEFGSRLIRCLFT